MAHNPNEKHKGHYCSDGSWAINNTGIYYPEGSLHIDNESIQSDDTGRTEDGTMHITWVAGKVKVFLKWKYLTGNEVKHLKNLMYMKEYTLHFVDLGEQLTAECYTTKFSYTKVSEDDGYADVGGLYTEITADAIEI